MGNSQCACEYGYSKENNKIEILKLDSIKEKFEKKFREVQKKTYQIAEKENKGMVNQKFYDLRLREGLQLKNKTNQFLHFNQLEIIVISILYVIDIQLIASSIVLEELNRTQIILDKGNLVKFPFITNIK